MLSLTLLLPLNAHTDFPGCGLLPEKLITADITVGLSCSSSDAVYCIFHA